MTDSEQRKSEDRPSLGELVRYYRGRKGWSQGQLAVYAQVSRSFITKLEQGHYKTVEPPTLQHLADALGAPLKELLEAAGIRDAPDRPVPRELPGTEDLPPAFAQVIQRVGKYLNARDWEAAATFLEWLARRDGGSGPRGAAPDAAGYQAPDQADIGHDDQGQRTA